MIYPHTPTVAPEKAASPSALVLCSFLTTGGERASMKMYEIEITTELGDIHITQTSADDGPQVVVMTPDQAELVCKWIMDAARRQREPVKQTVLRD